MKDAMYTVCLWSVLALLASCPFVHADTTTPVKVLAHYMPWFRMERRDDDSMIWAHWGWSGGGVTHNPDDMDKQGRRDIASVYYPLIGPYDGRDPITLEYHMLTAKAAGIQGFVADWYGPDDFSDAVFSAMVSAAERYGMKVAVCLEEKAFFPPYSSAASRAEVQEIMVKHMRHVLEKYTDSPAYLHVNGRPVFFIFTGYGQGDLGQHILSGVEISDVLSRVGTNNLLYVRPLLDAAYFPAVRGSYVWAADGQAHTAYYQAVREARKNGQLDYWVGGVYPGFNDTGVWGWGNGPRITERRGTELYEKTWKAALTHDPDAIQIATWNDFEEGTTIEPAREYGFTYLDRTEQFVEDYTGRHARPGDNRLPFELYRLRRTVASLKNLRQREKWTKKLDGVARDLNRGDVRGMGMRMAIMRMQLSLNRKNKVAEGYQKPD